LPAALSAHAGEQQLTAERPLKMPTAFVMPDAAFCADRFQASRAPVKHVSQANLGSQHQLKEVFP